MEMTKNNLPKLNINFILTNGKKISSQEALNDTIPVEWNEDVLKGKYKNKTIIKLIEFINNMDPANIKYILDNLSADD